MESTFKNFFIISTKSKWHWKFYFIILSHGNITVSSGFMIKVNSNLSNGCTPVQMDLQNYQISKKIFGINIILIF